MRSGAYFFVLMILRCGAVRCGAVRFSFRARTEPFRSVIENRAVTSLDADEDADEDEAGLEPAGI